jgi:hypothetical protein
MQQLHIATRHEPAVSSEEPKATTGPPDSKATPPSGKQNFSTAITRSTWMETIGCMGIGYMVMPPWM